MVKMCMVYLVQLVVMGMGPGVIRDSVRELGPRTCLQYIGELGPT